MYENCDICFQLTATDASLSPLPPFILSYLPSAQAALHACPLPQSPLLQHLIHLSDHRLPRFFLPHVEFSITFLSPFFTFLSRQLPFHLLPPTPPRLGPPSLETFIRNSPPRVTDDDDVANASQPLAASAADADGPASRKCPMWLEAGATPVPDGLPCWMDGVRCTVPTQLGYRTRGVAPPGSLPHALLRAFCSSPCPS